MQEAGFTKADVRALARAWGLPTWDKPASPCLSSRLAPGVSVTHERTARVEAAEEYLRVARLSGVPGAAARGRTGPHRGAGRGAGPPGRARGARALVRRLKELGFRFVTLDLEGFRSGSLNDLVGVDTKRLFANP